MKDKLKPPGAVFCLAAYLVPLQRTRAGPRLQGAATTTAWWRLRLRLNTWAAELWGAEARGEGWGWNAWEEQVERLTGWGK